MPQLVKRLTLDLSSGHDLTVCEIEPHVGLCADSIEPILDSVSPLSLSLKRNKYTYKKRNTSFLLRT